MNYTIKAGTFAPTDDKPDWASVKSVQGGKAILDALLDGLNAAYDNKSSHPGRVVIQIVEDEAQEMQP